MKARVAPQAPSRWWPKSAVAIRRALATATRLRAEQYCRLRRPGLSVIEWPPGHVATAARSRGWPVAIAATRCRLQVDKQRETAMHDHALIDMGVGTADRGCTWRNGITQISHESGMALVTVAWLLQGVERSD